METIGFLIDAVVVIAFGMFVLTNYQKGLLYAVYETVAVFVSSIFASLLSTPLATLIYDNFISGNVIKEVDRIVKSTGVTDDDVLNKVFESFPVFVQNGLRSIGISEENLSYTISQTKLDIPQAAESLARPIFLNFISVVCSAVLFLIFMSVLYFVVKLLTKSVNFMGLSVLNRIGGAAVGIIKSIFLFMVIACIFYILMAVMPTDAAYEFQKQIQSTTLFKLVFEFNIPSMIISSVAGISGIALF